MSAWLLKKKSGSAIVRMRQYNKRFFTIDFDSRVFFYAHSKDSKKVSSVVRFCDIVDVQLPDPLAGSSMGRATSDSSDLPMEKQDSRPSLLRRSFSLRSTEATPPAKAHHYVNLTVKPGKVLELLCATAAEAEEWHQGFREALLCGRGYSDELSTSATGPDTFSEGEAEADAFRTVTLGPAANDSAPPASRTPARPPAGTVSAEAIAAATADAAAPTRSGRFGRPPREISGMVKSAEPKAAPAAAARGQTCDPSGYPAMDGAKAAPATVAGYVSTAPLAPSETTEAEPVATPEAAPQAASAPAASATDDGDDGDDAASPPQRGTFLDFSVEPVEEEKALPEVESAAVDTTTASIVETSGIFSANDFGFDASEDTDSSGSAVSTPREFGRGGARPSLPKVAEDAPVATAGVDSAGGPSKEGGLRLPKTSTAAPADAVATEAPSKAGGAESGRTYDDRQRGMSMQERLANLEFSDDEDDDPDDPLGLKK